MGRSWSGRRGSLPVDSVFRKWPSRVSLAARKRAPRFVPTFSPLSGKRLQKLRFLLSYKVPNLLRGGAKGLEPLKLQAGKLRSSQLSYARVQVK